VDIKEKLNFLNASLQGKEKFIHNFLERLKHLKQSYNFGKGSHAKMYLIIFRAPKVHLEMVKVTMVLNMLMKCKVAT